MDLKNVKQFLSLSASYTSQVIATIFLLPLGAVILNGIVLYLVLYFTPPLPDSASALDGIIHWASQLALGVFIVIIIPFGLFFRTRIFVGKRILEKIYTKNKDNFYEIIQQSVKTNIIANTEKEEKDNQKSISSERIRHFSNHFERLGYLDKPMKFLFNFFIDNVPLANVIQKVHKKTGFRRDNIVESTAMLTVELDKAILNLIHTSILSHYRWLILFNLLAIGVYILLVIA